ncbi:MAG: hypothetical protein R3F17_14180 [Planctomycetota bacterium]
MAHLSQVQGPAEVRRIGNNRAILVTAASEGLDLGGTPSASKRPWRTCTCPTTSSSNSRR